MGVGGTVEGEHIVCPWHGWQWRGDGTNALIPYSKIGCKQNVKIKTLPRAGVVRVHRGVARAPWPRALLAAAGASRAGNRRVLPAAPALPDAQPGQGACADDHRERRRSVSRAVRPQGRQRRQHHVVRCQRLPPARDGDRELRRRPRVDMAHARRTRRRQHHLRQLLAGARHRAVPQGTRRDHRGDGSDPGRRGLHRLLLHPGVGSRTRRHRRQAGRPRREVPCSCNRKSSSRTSSPGRT